MLHNVNVQFANFRTTQLQIFFRKQNKLTTETSKSVTTSYRLMLYFVCAYFAKMQILLNMQKPIA